MPRKPTVVYLVFAGPHFYPKGGFDDLQLATKSKTVALEKKAKLRRTYDWVTVVGIQPRTLYWEYIEDEPETE